MADTSVIWVITYITNGEELTTEQPHCKYSSEKAVMLTYEHFVKSIGRYDIRVIGAKIK